MTDEDLLSGKYVLIVDDHLDVLDSLSELLTMCKIDRASSFEDARKKLESRDYDIAVLDIMGVDGYTLLDIAKQRNITSVMLTANALSPEDTIKSHKKGAAYYLPKEELVNIDYHLNDVLIAKKEGKNTWRKWFDTFASFYERKFGVNWQDKNADYWLKFKDYI